MGHGRFMWYELMTSDVDAAKAFYTETIGWSVMPWGDEGYQMWAVGERPIGGLMTLPEEAEAMGAPPHWIAYNAVTDADATAAKVAELGGAVLKAPWDIPEVGRIAILRDPQGAVFAVIQPQQEMPAAPPEPGDVTWHELNTTDHAAAWKFYSALFGWSETMSMDMGEGVGTYFMFKDEGSEGSVGGMCDLAKAMGMPPHWLYYVTVDDLDGAVGRITAKGGKVVNGPMEVPGGDRVAQCMDPQGVAFAIHWRNPNPPAEG